MTREEISRAISGLDEGYVREALAYSPGLDSSAEKENMNRMNISSTPRPAKRRILTVALAATLLLALGVSASAVALTRRAEGFAGNATYSQGVGDNGEPISVTTLHTDSLTDPVEFRDRLYFTANGENQDISDLISTETPFLYDYVDESGNTHYLIVGLNGRGPDDYGYAEFVKDGAGNWLGGYSARVNLEEDGSLPLWLTNGKAELGVPW